MILAIRDIKSQSIFYYVEKVEIYAATNFIITTVKNRDRV